MGCLPDARILGDNNSNVPKIMQVMAIVLSKGTSLADTETVSKMKMFLTQMKSNLPAQVRQSHASSSTEFELQAAHGM